MTILLTFSTHLLFQKNSRLILSNFKKYPLEILIGISLNFQMCEELTFLQYWISLIHFPFLFYSIFSISSSFFQLLEGFLKFTFSFTTNPIFYILPAQRFEFNIPCFCSLRNLYWYQSISFRGIVSSTFMNLVGN